MDSVLVEKPKGILYHCLYFLSKRNGFLGLGYIVASVGVLAVMVSGYCTLLALGLEPQDVLHPQGIFHEARIVLAQQTAKLQRVTSMGCRDTGCIVYSEDGRASFNILAQSVEPYTNDVLSLKKNSEDHPVVALSDSSQTHYSLLASYTLFPKIFTTKKSLEFSVTYSLKDVHENLRSDARVAVFDPKSSQYHDLEDAQCVRNGTLVMCSGKTSTISTLGILVPSDADGDGVADTVDSCPLIRGSSLERGCPDVRISLRSSLFALTDTLVQGDETQVAGASVKVFAKKDIERGNFGLDARSAKTLFEQTTVAPQDTCSTDYRGTCVLSVTDPDEYLIVGALNMGDIDGDGAPDALYALEAVSRNAFVDDNHIGSARDGFASLSFFSLKSNGESGARRRDDFASHDTTVFGDALHLIYPTLLDSRVTGYMLPIAVYGTKDKEVVSAFLHCDDMPGVRCTPSSQVVNMSEIAGKRYLFFHITKDTTSVLKNPTDGAHMDLSVRRGDQEATFPIYAVPYGHISGEGIVAKDTKGENFLLKTLNIGTKDQ